LGNTKRCTEANYGKQVFSTIEPWMKNIYSLIACCVVSIILLHYRVSHSDLRSDIPLKVTTWDAFGYYMYLPSIFIYQDVTDLEWLPEIDSIYSVTGGKVYQANKNDNGNYVFKYFGGVSIMETPFFLLGHLIASNTKYEADGFSLPYQYAIAFGAVIYCILALFLLRSLLLRYFSDRSTAISIILLITATNLIQYVSVDSGMSHAYIFPLYVVVIYTTIKWHSKPNILWASLTGLTVGLATICRPTEVIMLFIPLLWNTQTKEVSKEKWKQVKNHRIHLLYVVLFGLIGILPQLIYWKIASGSFVYNVGSKWVFLNPFFRVLFGWESGWFIYTPITILFILGFFFIKKNPFKKSVIVFCLLNIWIVISWFDWKYGATYSTRALVQSYPVLIFPFTAIIERINLKKWRYVFYLLGLYLIYVNLFQLQQYSDTILHYRDMNRQYYGKIYLNRNPSPLDMSLLDTREFLKDEKEYGQSTIVSSDSIVHVRCSNEFSGGVLETSIAQEYLYQAKTDAWVRIESRIKIQSGFTNSYLNCEIQSGDSVKHSRIRLFSPISRSGESNDYAFYMKVPNLTDPLNLKLYISTMSSFSGSIEEIRIIYLERKEENQIL